MSAITPKHVCITGKIPVNDSDTTAADIRVVADIYSDDAMNYAIENVQVSVGQGVILKKDLEQVFLPATYLADPKEVRGLEGLIRLELNTLSDFCDTPKQGAENLCNAVLDGISMFIGAMSGRQRVEHDVIYDSMKELFGSNITFFKDNSTVKDVSCVIIGEDGNTDEEFTVEGNPTLTEWHYTWVKRSVA